MRYSLREQTGIDDQPMAVNHYTKLADAIYFAKQRNATHLEGTAVHIVWDLCADATKYSVGWLDKTKFRGK